MKLSPPSFSQFFVLAAFSALIVSSQVLSELSAANSPWTNANRIAITADGNPDADADDVGATAFTLAVLAKAGLQNNLVHYSFNNFLEYKVISSGGNRMWLSAMGGQTRWGFDANRFHDAGNDPDGAVAHLTAQIDASTADDPLYLIAAGPMEIIYRALEAADPSARNFVVIISHHDYNEYFKPRLWQRNWNAVKTLVPGIGYLRIQDQNGSNGNGLKGSADSDFHWLRDHADANLNWVYDRVVAGKPDVSDAGMLTWLIGINGSDEKVTIPEMQTWFGSAVIPTNGGSSSTPAAPAGVEPEVIPPETESIFQEVDGKIVIEAESVPLTDNWQLLTTDIHYEAGDNPNFSGEGYIRWVPSWIGKIDHQHQGVLIYKLRITNPGNYRMALHSSHKGAPERDKWNDCWTVMGLNPVNPYGITRKTYHSINNDQFNAGTDFSWQTTHDNYGTVAQTDGHFSTPLYTLTAGDHYFFIVGRSGGFRINKIHLFKEGVSGFKSDSEPVTPILSGKTVAPTAHIHMDGDDVVLGITDGSPNGWFSVFSKVHLHDPEWIIRESGVRIDGSGNGSVTVSKGAAHEFFILRETDAPPPALIEFVTPYYINGSLNGQQSWNAESGWTVADSGGSGYATTPDTQSVAVLNEAILLDVGEKFGFSINFQFGGSYSTPTGFVYAFSSGLKGNNTAVHEGTGSTAADANIQILSGSDEYRLLSNFSAGDISGESSIETGAINEGDLLQFDYELTLGANAATTTYTVRLQNLTDGTDTGVGTVTGVDAGIYSALTGTGAYMFFQSINAANNGAGLENLRVNSITFPNN
ncbi:MAG: hypothetical protein AAGJ81_00495 [Verrucomicrobiota bacterium]